MDDVWSTKYGIELRGEVEGKLNKTGIYNQAVLTLRFQASVDLSN